MWNWRRTRLLRRLVLGLAVAAMVAPAAPAGAVPGALDPSFGFGDGKVLTNMTGGFDAAVEVAVQSDGKLVAAGQAGGSGQRIALARYDADGGLDLSFGGDGKVFTNLTGGLDSAYEVVLQGDGKIVVAGVANLLGDARFALVRYNEDGTLDTTFGGDGKVTTNLTDWRDFANGLVVQADGKLVAVGRAGGSGGRFALARYESDGGLDPSFGGDGKVTTNFANGNDLVDTVAIQADEKIVVAGAANGSNSHPFRRFALARYNLDGTLDPGFGGDGKVTTKFSELSRGAGAYALALQSDQKIVAAGFAGHRVGVVRYDVNGALDPTFGGDGKVRTDFGGGTDFAEDLVIQSDGKIVAAGGANSEGANSRFLLARYNVNGALDTTFGGDGKVTTNFSAGLDIAFSVAIQPSDDRIVAAGFTSGRGWRFALAGYQMN
jgi:uncharacterized delta-60 repeat protein